MSAGMATSVLESMDYAIDTGLAEATGAIETPYREHIRTDLELRQWVREHLNIHIPYRQCCRAHTPPFTAFAESYFARSPLTVWMASRAFGGKTVLLATLACAESITLGAGVNVLGGSGEQSARVLGYLTGIDTNLPYSFWNAPGAPRELIRSEISRKTSLTNGGRIHALMASTRSVRGPHPQRLRLDEVDEMDRGIFTAATGQPMSLEDPITGRRIATQIVASSTWHYPDKTMAYVLRQAAEKKWPVFEWCYRESVRG